MRRAFSIFAKILLGLTLTVVVLLGAALLALRVPAVQTRVAHAVVERLSRQLGQPVAVDFVDVRPFSRVVLEGVRVGDRRGGELLGVGRAEADITLFSIFNPRHLHVGTLTLERPRFELRTVPGQPDSTTFDQLLKAVRRLTGPPDTAKTTSTFDFQLAELRLRNGTFVRELSDEARKPHFGRSVDYGHMLVDSISGDFSGFGFGPDTTRVRVAGLRLVERNSKTRIQELTARIKFHSRLWEFAGLRLRVGRSVLRQFVRFEYRQFGNFSDFNDSVRVVAQLRNTRLFSDDLAKFAPDLASLRDSVFLSGEAKGYVRDFQIKNLDLRYGRRTRLVAARAHADNLPRWRESLIDLRLRPSQIDAADLRRWLPADANKLVQRLGLVRLNGQFVGFYNDFVGKAEFRTALGDLATDVNLKTKTDFSHAVYEGHVRSAGFQLGKFLGDESLIRDVALNGRVEGTGFVAPVARGRARATVPAIWLNGYRYRNLTVDGEFADTGFKGKLTAADPNLQMQADGSFNLDPRRQLLDVQARIGRANLGALGYFPRPLVVSAQQARLKLRGTSLDSLLGAARLRGARLSLGKQSARLDTLDVLSTRNARGQRTVSLRSELLDLTVRGAFETAVVRRDLETLWHEYRLNFESNAARTAAYYQRKRQRPLARYTIELDANLKHVNPLLDLFLPDLQVADRSRLDGSFRQGETSIFQLGGRFDSIWYGPVHTERTTFDFTTSKLPYRPAVLAQADHTSARQELPGLGRTERLVLEGVWDQQRINFSTQLAQSGTTNRADLNGAVEFLPRAVQVVFKRSGLHLLDRDYVVAADNALRISDYGRHIDVDHFLLSSGNQRLEARGSISPDPQEPPLAIEVENFDLSSLNTLTGQRLGGRLHAQASLSGVYRELALNSTLAVDSLVYEGVPIGQVAGRGDWNTPQHRLEVNLDVTRRRQRVLGITGYVAPGATQQLALTGTLADAPLVLAQPFLGGLLTGLGGTGRGQLTLGGRFAAPTLAGAVDVSDGRFTFAYLGTTYTFADRLNFTTSSISFQNVRLRDALGNQGTVSGLVRHQGFQNMVLDLSASFRRFQVLKTTRRDNDLYFGTAYATGTASVRGPVDDLVVDVRATSEAGTRLALPLDNTAKAEQASYIRFVNENLPDSVRRRQAVQAATLAAQSRVDLSGIRLNMNLTVTPAAYLEIILNEATGDVMRGTASGQLRLNIDTRGDFNMYGQLEIVRGMYNFSLQGLVNKEFNIRPGGTVTWNGDPFDGQLNVAATYTQRTSLGPVLQNANYNAGPVPVTAVINLTGALLQPTIRLALDFDDAPGSLQNDLAPFLALLRNDEQELNRQVFSLLVFRSLASTQNAFAGISLTGAGGQSNAVQSSLGQIISSQLGLLTSQLDPNLEIDFNLNGLSADQLQALQVRLSYSLLGGRLRLTREGGVGTQTINPVTNLPNAQASLLGDFSLDYALRPDGKFRARLRYETTPRDNIVTTVNQPRAGISLLHTKEFNNLRELLGRDARRQRPRPARPERRVLTVEEDQRTSM